MYFIICFFSIFRLFSTNNINLHKTDLGSTRFNISENHEKTIQVKKMKIQNKSHSTGKLCSLISRLFSWLTEFLTKKILKIFSLSLEKIDDDLLKRDRICLSSK